MLQQASTALRPDSAPATAARPARISPEGIGDVVDAGRRSGYAHLSERRLPTIGRLVAAARGAADAMRRPTLWPSRRGRWQVAPRAARRHVNGRLRVTVVALDPNTFVPEPAVHPGRRHSLEVLFPVSGRAHLIASGPGGEMLSAAELVAGRARVVGSAQHATGARPATQHLVNTGDEVAVVVRVTA
ncbi:hypothetical protein [Nocardiopsis sp. FIRDI 009]|uniref:hypothetical protein n=1 Tax=Nocardiopsis sp. FIRDI 009 TaxID=714197 RepID=UPI000E239DE5|nr:hypothetical protein [Nocardiopsis sp. FIRDI 009]